jgi:hypothetical protein
MAAAMMWVHVMAYRGRTPHEQFSLTRINSIARFLRIFAFSGAPDYENVILRNTYVCLYVIRMDGCARC